MDGWYACQPSQKYNAVAHREQMVRCRRTAADVAGAANLKRIRRGLPPAETSWPVTADELLDPPVGVQIHLDPNPLLYVIRARRQRRGQG